MVLPIEIRTEATCVDREARVTSTKVLHHRKEVVPAPSFNKRHFSVQHTARSDRGRHAAADQHPLGSIIFLLFPFIIFFATDAGFVNLTMLSGPLHRASIFSTI